MTIPKDNTTDDNWHTAFHPRSFLNRVRLDQFLDKHLVEQGCIKSRVSPCILCRGTTTPGLRLNDGAFLCSNCFTALSRVSYPEKYESLRRDYLVQHEAWRMARSAYILAAAEQSELCSTEWTEARKTYSSQSPYSGMLSFFGVAAFISIFVVFVFPPVGIAGVLLSVIIGAICGSADTNRLKEWEAKNPRPSKTKDTLSPHYPEWDRQNPEPRKPELYHFHDPQAVLTTRDLAILHVFNHWPGYPPFWDYLKTVVHQRDGNRCQVTGCPSRVAIHVHHKLATSQGGQHTPDNLVCLCAFHHGLEPEVGHERVWGDIKNRYFTLVRAHKRNNPSGIGEHYVCAHVRRLELVTPQDLNTIASFYGFICPKCRNSKLIYSVNEGTCEVGVRCNSCNGSWTATRALTEETGPRLAEILVVSRNGGRWQANWNMFAERNDAVFKAQKVRAHRQGTIRSSPPTSSQKSPLRKQVGRPSASVRQSLSRVTEDLSRALNTATIKYAHEHKFITNWECHFYSDTIRKRSLSYRQSLVRMRINKKVLKQIGEKLS